jgi:hypothetical protein
MRIYKNEKLFLCTHLYPGRDAMLDNPVVAGGHVALAQVVALEYHRRLVEVEAVLQGSVLVVPAPDMNIEQGLQYEFAM